MAFRKGFRGPSQTPTRKMAVSWGVGLNALNVNGAATTSQVWTNGVTLQNDNEATIVRTRGSFLLQLVLQTAANDGFDGALGIGIVNSQAFAAGAVSMPMPITEPDWPGWLWYQHVQIRANTATEADGSNAVSTTIRGEIDSKAMRKFGIEEVIFGALELNLSGGATFRFNADTRMLFKLP